ncbi:MAG: hypothetical protein ACOCU8_03300 [Patescibacteria group bacterium]
MRFWLVSLAVIEDLMLENHLSEHVILQMKQGQEKKVINEIVTVFRKSKKVYSKMIQNLVWALGYNIVAIPAAAGVFATWGFFLRPEIGALVMSLSTVIVVINALMLKRIEL